jgi:hypothetical protein
MASRNNGNLDTTDVGEDQAPTGRRAAESKPRLVVELSQRAAAMLDDLVELEELNKTTVVNRAIQVYGMLRKAEASGGTVLLAEREGDELARVRFI